MRLTSSTAASASGTTHQSGSLAESSPNDLDQKETYENEKRPEGVNIDVTVCDECKTLTACPRDTAVSGSRWQNPRRVKRVVAGTCEGACRRAKRSLDPIG